MLDSALMPYFVREPTPERPEKAEKSEKEDSRQRLRGRLSEHVSRLEVIRSAVSVSVAALRHQNCELDEDVASVLQRSVSDKLQDEIETTTQIVESLPQP